MTVSTAWFFSSFSKESLEALVSEFVQFMSLNRDESGSPKGAMPGSASRPNAGRDGLARSPSVQQMAITA